MLVVLVQARMGSTRLPGKVLRTIAGRPMLAYQIERLRRCRSADRLVIATSTRSEDDVLAAFAAAEGIACFRGSEADVLSRFASASRKFAAQTVVRVTGDCPLLEGSLVDRAVEVFTEGRFDYLSNTLEPSWPYGLAVEVVTARALYEADENARDPAEREHVTPYIYWRPQKFRIKSLTRSPDLSHHRWTVDTPEDFELVSRIIDALYRCDPQFSMQQVLQVLDANPSWQSINQHVRQKSVQHAREDS